MTIPPEGTLIGLDVGTQRIGIARADARARLAAPLQTIDRHGVKKDIARLQEALRKVDVALVVVGLPYDLDGSEGRIARLARQVGDALGAATGWPIAYQDERYSSLEAERLLKSAQVRQRRSVLDQASAAVILQDWINGSMGAGEGQK